MEFPNIRDAGVKPVEAWTDEFKIRLTNGVFSDQVATTFSSHYFFIRSFDYMILVFAIGSSYHRLTANHFDKFTNGSVNE